MDAVFAEEHPLANAQGECLVGQSDRHRTLDAVERDLGSYLVGRDLPIPLKDKVNGFKPVGLDDCPSDGLVGDLIGRVCGQAKIDHFAGAGMMQGH